MQSLLDCIYYDKAENGFYKHRHMNDEEREAYENFYKSLSREQERLLDIYEGRRCSRMDEHFREIFISGFNEGVRMATKIFKKEY